MVTGEIAQCVSALIQGKPHFVIIEIEPNKVKLAMNNMRAETITTALTDLGKNIPQMKDILTDVAINVNN